MYIRWYDNDVRFVLDQPALLIFFSECSLKQESVGRYVRPLWHIILIPVQPIFVFFLNSACLDEKHQIPILESYARPDLGSNQSFTTREARTQRNT